MGRGQYGGKLVPGTHAAAIQSMTVGLYWLYARSSHRTTLLCWQGETAVSEISLALLSSPLLVRAAWRAST